MFSDHRHALAWWYSASRCSRDIGACGDDESGGDWLGISDIEAVHHAR
jgi:hypothetical protein